MSPASTARAKLFHRSTHHSELIALYGGAGFFQRKRQELALEQFLAGAERRAYQSALLTTPGRPTPWISVQDAMLQLVQHYRTHTAEEGQSCFNAYCSTKSSMGAARQRQQGLWQPVG